MSFNFLIMHKKILIICLTGLIHTCVFAQPCTNPVTSNCADAVAGTSEFIMSGSSNVVFEFDKMSEYVSGITISGTTMLRLKIDELVAGSCKWKLMMYIDNNGYLPNNEWEPMAYYGVSGDNPELDLIQVKVYNGCGTPLNSGVFQIFAGNIQYDILDVIPDQALINPNGTCDGTMINSPGSYLTDYNEYNFIIDYRIIPGYTLRPGNYEIKIHFCLSEVP